ncbi:MAG: PAS domain S-box protein [Pseudomonadota bacterium]
MKPSAGRQPRETDPKWMRFLLDLPFVGVCVFDLQTRRWVRLNDRFCALLGYERREMARLDWRQVCHPLDQADCDAKFRRLVQRRARHVRMVHRLLRKDGSFIRAEIDLSLAQPRAGPREMVVALVADVTERDRARAAHREAEEKLQAVVEQSIIGIYIIEDERLAHVNPRFAEIFGYTVAELFGMPAVELVAPQDRDLVLENIRRRVAGELRSMRYEFRGRRKDGSLIELGAHGSTATLRGKRVIVGVLQDITERKRGEQRVQGYVRRLESAMLATVDSITRIIDLRDPYTAGHERRVAHISAAIARRLGLEDERVRGLEIAGRLHDIGKISIPAEILAKPARLSGAEFEIVKLHAEHGLRILNVVDFPWPVAQIAHQHHERLDGSGYPQGLMNGAILPEARILAVADVIEAMASHRPYRASLGVAPALEEIERGAGQHYDPDVAACALRLFREGDYQIPA